jgi:3-methyladenine DNA glycosylase AlkD
MNTSLASDIIEKLRNNANPKNVEGMQRYGIRGEHILGVSLYEIRNMAKGVHDHALALELWKTGIHEAQLMASIVDIPSEATRGQLEEWVNDFDSWDVCDQVCTNLVDISPHAIACIHDWAKRDKEFVRRAAFATLAGLAVHNKTLKDDEFEQFFELITKYCKDERNFVRRAVNWALRNIGKRNIKLCKRAMEVAKQLDQIDDKTAHWIAKDALRELKGKLEKMEKGMKN